MLSSFSFQSLCLTLSGKHIRCILRDELHFPQPANQKQNNLWPRLRLTPASRSLLSRDWWQPDAEHLQHCVKSTPTEAAVSEMSALSCFYLFMYLFCAYSWMRLYIIIVCKLFVDSRICTVSPGGRCWWLEKMADFFLWRKHFTWWHVKVWRCWLQNYNFFKIWSI